jgi:hypothetical protein
LLLFSWLLSQQKCKSRFSLITGFSSVVPCSVRSACHKKSLAAKL